MIASMSGLWLMVTVVTGAVGTAMLVYGIRQREPLSLCFGIGISIIPMIISSGWGVAAASAATFGLFLFVRKIRW
jgi:hypothetical protein